VSMCVHNIYMTGQVLLPWIYLTKHFTLLNAKQSTKHYHRNIKLTQISRTFLLPIYRSSTTKWSEYAYYNCSSAQIRRNSHQKQTANQFYQYEHQLAFTTKMATHVCLSVCFSPLSLCLVPRLSQQNGTIFSLQVIHKWYHHW